MGTCLTIRTKGITATKANSLWRKEFPIENLEAEMKENFYGDKQGYTLHFYTGKDLLLDAKWMRDAEKRVDLGFKPDLTDNQAKALYSKMFNSWSIIGHCEIKLSGEHYCTHKLQRVKQFLDKYPDLFTVDGYDDLSRYIEYRQVITTSAYCGRCIMEARKLGIALPVNANQGNKSTQNGFIDADGKDVTDICNSLVSYSFSSKFWDSLNTKGE